MVVVHILPKHPLEVLIIEGDHVIEAFGLASNNRSGRECFERRGDAGTEE